MKSMLPKNLEAVFLDFDGVVLESADIKTDAFYELYLPYGAVVATNARDHHLMHQGVNRNKKFTEIHKKYLDRDCTQDEMVTMSNNFSKIVCQKIFECKFVDGVIDFLKLMIDREVPTFLLSATPHVELNEICNKKSIAKYFKGIYGAPNEKSEVGSNLIRENSFVPEQVMFIGDSRSDFNAASSLGVKFIGRVAKNLENPFDAATEIICSFKDILT